MMKLARLEFEIRNKPNSRLRKQKAKWRDNHTARRNFWRQKITSRSKPAEPKFEIKRRSKAYHKADCVGRRPRWKASYAKNTAEERKAIILIRPHGEQGLPSKHGSRYGVKL